MKRKKIRKKKKKRSKGKEEKKRTLKKNKGCIMSSLIPVLTLPADFKVKPSN